MDKKKGLSISKTWRSEIKSVIAFFFLGALSIWLSHEYPGSVVAGKLFSIGSTTLMLSLPLFWFLPMFALGRALVRIYNVHYVIDQRGIEAHVGILAMNQRITRVRFEDIRSVETDQTIVERALDIGNVEIGTAATSGVEVVFEGVAAPYELQDMILRERDNRQRAARRAAVAAPPDQARAQV